MSALPIRVWRGLNGHPTLYLNKCLGLRQGSVMSHAYSMTARVRFSSMSSRSTGSPECQSNYAFSRCDPALTVSRATSPCFRRATSTPSRMTLKPMEQSRSASRHAQLQLSQNRRS